MSLLKNTLWNLVGTGLPFLVGIFAFPYLVRHIGVEAFGILTLIWALIGYFGLFDLGLGRALTQQIAARLASQDHSHIPHLAKSGLLFTVVTGLIGGLILAALAYPLGHFWLKVSPQLQSDTICSLVLAAVGIPLTTASTGFRGVLEAYEDFRAVNILRMALGVANFGLPVLSVMLLGPSLHDIVAMLIVARLLVMAAQWKLAYDKLPMGWARSTVNKEDARELLSFGAWMTVSNIISPLMVNADRFIIAGVLGAGIVAYYTVPFEVLTRLLVLPAALTSALFPRLAVTMMADRNSAKRIYERSTRLVVLGLAPVCLLIAAGSHWGLVFWLGQDFASKSWLIVVVMSMGLLFNGIAYVPYATIQAVGDARTTAIFHIFECLIYMPLLFLLLHYFGILGAAMAWVVRVGIDLGLLFGYVKKSLFREDTVRAPSRPTSAII